MEKNMASISTKNIMLKSDNSELSFEMRRKSRGNDY